METVAMVISIAAVVAIAWEAGIIAALVDAAGGTAIVLTSVVISEIIYLVTARHRTVEGFILAAIDGYLFALTFRFGGIAGRAIAVRIGTATFPRLVGGWVVERLTVATLGGGLGGGLVTFSHGITNVLLHQGQFPTLGEFVRGMTMGVLLGLLGEFVIGPVLQGAFRVGGPTVLNTIADAVRVVRESGTSPARYAAEISQALGSLRQRLSQFLEEASVREIMAGLRERLAAIGEGLEALPGAARRRLGLAAYRRVFELADVGLGRVETDGLERLLASTEAGAGAFTRDELLAFLNGVARDRARALDFLHGLGRLSDARAAAVVAGRQLDALSRATNLLRSLRNLDPDLVWDVWRGNAFSLNAGEFESFLGRVAGGTEEQRIFALEVLRRPDQLVTPEGVAQALEKSGLTNDIVRGLDRLYEGLDAAQANRIMAGVARGNAASYLLFLGRLHPANVQQLGTEGFLAPLSAAPRVVEFASQGQNIRTLRGLATAGGQGNVREVVAGLDEFLAREAALTPAEQIEAAGLLRGLLAVARRPRFRFPELPALRTAASRGREVGLAGGLNRGLELVTGLVGDDVHPAVADRMLALPAGRTVTDVVVPGQGIHGPDVQIRTTAGVVGRESVAVTPRSVPTDPAAAQARVRATLIDNMLEKVDRYGAGGAYDHSVYASRELDVQIRRARDGNSFDAVLDETLFQDVMRELRRRSANTGLIDRVRFYGADGNVVFEWTP